MTLKTVYLTRNERKYENNINYYKMENNRRGCTISSLPFVIATLILMILKLCGVMTYSWWWVFAPLTVIPAVFLVWFVVLILIGLITALIHTFD